VNEVTKQQGTEQAVDVDSLAGEAELELASRESFSETEDEGADLTPLAVQSMGERKAIIEALIYVSDEPLNAKSIAEVLKEDQSVIEAGIASLVEEFNGRNSGLQLREVAGGWQFATRPEYHEHVRAFLKWKPSAKLSLASLETLAVVAYKQPITVPEILDIRGVQSPSSIKTLLDKKLIVAKGRKEAIGRPMMYGTSKEFLIQFGLKDLSELPSIEDFEDLASGVV
jgi:segregation and condensation protein B